MLTSPTHRPRRVLLPAVLASLALLVPGAGAIAGADAADPHDVSAARQAPPNALYRMVSAKFAVKAKTNGLGNVKYYETTWKRPACGLKGFKASTTIPGEGFDSTGFAHRGDFLSQSMDGKVYEVKSVESGRISGEKFLLRQKLQLRPKGSTKAWCTVRKNHVAYRSYGGAGVTGPVTGPAAGRVATPGTTYRGPGFVLRTNAKDRVVRYQADWKRRVCGIRDFGVWYSSTKGLAVDRAGLFSATYSFVYPQGEKKWTVKGADAGQVGKVTGFDGVTRDTATLRLRVKIRPKGSTGRWCTASRTFSGTAR